MFDIVEVRDTMEHPVCHPALQVYKLRYVQCPQWPSTLIVLGHPRTFGTWDSGQYPWWDQLRYPRMSQNITGHLGPGTLGNVLGGAG